MSVVHIFFAPMGAGKSYLAAKFADENKMPFFEGDLAIPKPMSDRFNSGLPLTRKMVVDFIRDHLLQAIAARCTDTDLVVAQALYLRVDRLWLLHQLAVLGHTVKFYEVKTPFRQHMAQLWSRGPKWIWLWAINQPFFQSGGNWGNSLTVINNDRRAE